MPTFVYHFRNNPEKLEEMLVLRAFGWSYQALADKYECPKLTIRFLARKNGLGGRSVQVRVTRRDVRTTPPPPKYEPIIDPSEGRISEGKTYAEYLQIEEERKRKRLQPNV